MTSIASIQTIGSFVGARIADEALLANIVLDHVGADNVHEDITRVAAAVDKLDVETRHRVLGALRAEWATRHDQDTRRGEPSGREDARDADTFAALKAMAWRYRTHPHWVPAWDPHLVG